MFSAKRRVERFAAAHNNSGSSGMSGPLRIVPRDRDAQLNLFGTPPRSASQLVKALSNLVPILFVAFVDPDYGDAPAHRKLRLTNAEDY